jgi:hypothetical protein
MSLGAENTENPQPVVRARQWATYGLVVGGPSLQEESFEGGLPNGGNIEWGSK